MDHSLQILIEIMTKGGPQAEAVRQQLKQMAAEGSAHAKLAIQEAEAVEQKTIQSLKNVSAARMDAHVNDFKAFQKLEEEKEKARKQELKRQGKPPKLPQEEPAGIDPAMLRHWGAVLGNATGFHGLGMLAAAGGSVAGIGIAVSGLIQGLQSWLEQIEAITAASREFDTVEQRIESIATQTRRVTIHNKELQLSYADIARQVHTVATIIQQLIELDSVAIEMAGQRADAEKRAAIARVNLDQMFNPVERLRKIEAIEEEHFQNSMARERELEQRRMAAALLRFQMAGEREDTFQKRADAIKGALPGIAAAAERDAERSGAVDKEEDLKKAAIEAERKIVQEIALGNFDVLTGARYAGHRAKTSQELNPASESSDALVALGATGAIDSRLGRQSAITIATARLAELDKALESTKQNKSRAKQAMDESAGRLERAKKRLGVAEGEVISSEAERQKAQLEAEQLDRLIRERENSRSTIEQKTIDALRFDLQRDILQQSPPSIPPSGGGASNTNQELIDRLDKLVMLQTQANSFWNPA